MIDPAANVTIPPKGSDAEPLDDISRGAVRHDPAPEAIEPAHSTHGDVGEAVAEEDISFARRLRQPRTILSFLVAVVIIVLVVMRLNINVHEVWRNIRGANPLLLLCAFAVYYLSFPVRALRWQIILGNAGYDRAHGIETPSLAGLMEIIVLSWFANTLLPAKLGDIYRGYLFKKATGVSFTRTFGTILAERLMDILGLFSFLIVSGAVVFGNKVPRVAITLFLFGGALAIFGLIGLLVLRRAEGLLERIVPKKVSVQYRRLEEGIFGSFGRWPSLIGLTAILWTQEGLRVFFITRALGLHVSLAVTVFVALAAALLTTIPLTPAGLGVVETGIVGILQFVGVGFNDAASVAVVDRVIGYWSVLLIGLIIYIFSRKK
ncbi:MAG: flippase-like domain-containing protein [Thermomicrobia bacterium]|nr:flippase-like domain-containing protein [Thermomicrobia bacterium]MCA1722969.1 flippase-like domain-containing protein [Thermomicrobia bacterium]